MAFIGSDSLLAAEHRWIYPGVEEAPNLVLLDVSSSAGPPTRPREVRFVCGPHHRGMPVRIITEVAGSGDSSGMLEQDVPFYPDPSQRVLALLFFRGFDCSGGAQEIRVVRSEILLRLAREQREGIVEWDVWEEFTVTLDTYELPGTNPHAKYSVSGSRLVVVDTGGRWGKIGVYDLSHWSRQYPDTRLDEGGVSDERKDQFRLTKTHFELPERVVQVHHAVMVQDSMVFFSVRPSAPRFGLGFHKCPPPSLMITLTSGDPPH